MTFARALGACACALLVTLPSLAAGGAGERAASEIGRGGVMLIGTHPIGNLDPHFATSIPEIQILSQIYEQLTTIGASNRPAPGLADTWESPDGKNWTFTLRSGARFSDGRPVTADDVVFSIDRLRNPYLASPSVNLYSTISGIRALDANRIQFVLSESNAQFPGDLGSYHAAIVPAGTGNPAEDAVGSGPFMLARHIPGERVVLKRNPYYDLRDQDGNPLPYLEELHFIVSSEAGSQAEALLRGELDYLGGLTVETANQIRRSDAVTTITADANMHWLIHLGTAEGHPTSDNRVRTALKLATNHQALANLVRPGLAVIGNGFTPVGPAFGMYHLVRPPFRDTTRAKRLLADAGYPDGFAITLHVQDLPDAVRIATLWKQQMATIGVDVRLQIIPPEVYYGDGEQSWLSVEYGITEWGDRVTPVTYFKLGYVSGAPWNETGWSDQEFDDLTRRLDQEMNESRRILLYHRAQEILIDRGPVIVTFFMKAVAGVNIRLRGVQLAADWPRTLFRDAYLVP